MLKRSTTHGKSVNPVIYWRDRVNDAGFIVTSVQKLDRENRYIVAVVEP